jgi:hypothetical protein
MAPRKRVKGTKPKETMRQRQQRLLREQRAARNKNVRSQKALPPKATTGGRRYSSGTASSRRAQAAAKQVRAAQGTKGTTVRQGQPAGAAARRYGADRVARSVRRAQVETAVRGVAKRLKGVAGPIAAISTGAEIGEAMKKNLPVNTAGSGRGAGRRAFAGTKPKQTKKEQPKGKVKVQTDNTTVTRKKSRDYQAEKKAREAKASQPKKQQQTQTPKPKVKKGSGVSGVGPVASGRAYSVAKTGKSVTRQRVDELRAMRERSKKRQAAQKKKKK